MLEDFQNIQHRDHGDRHDSEEEDVPDAVELTDHETTTSMPCLDGFELANEEEEQYSVPVTLITGCLGAGKPHTHWHVIECSCRPGLILS